MKLKPINVCLVDDHPVLLSGILALLNSESNFNVQGTASNAGGAIAICEKYSPDVIVMDLNMPGNVIGAIKTIVSMSETTKVMAFTAVSGVDYAIAALEAGAAGYVLKGSTIDELKEAIEQVHQGENYISPSFAAKVVSGLRSASLRRTAREACRFSVREEQVLRLLLQGQTNKEIGEVLAISDKTVKHYMTVIMQKMNVRNRIEVVLAAQDMGISQAATAGGDGMSAEIQASGFH